MDAMNRFAPLSSERSTRLKLVAGYFGLNGVVMLALLLVGSLQAAFDPSSELRAVIAANPIGGILSAAMGVLLLVVAWQLYQRSRGAAIFAAVLLALPVAGWLLGAETDGAGVVINAIGLLLVASVWTELTPSAMWPRRGQPPASHRPAG